jgi:uncharacterized protein
MELTNEFEVSTGVEEAWRVLTDVERIAPCLPGAELREIEGDEYRGVVKVKVGPISAEYKGAARFVELDAAGHKAVLRAEGREARGQGNAAATITALLAPSGKGTKVSVVTDLSITGKVAQFGRGVLADVSAKLLGQFVENLEATVIQHGDNEAPAGAAAEAVHEQPKPGRGGRRKAARHEEEAPAEGEAMDAGAPSQNGSARQAASDHASHDHDEAEATEEAKVRRLEPRPVEPVDLMEYAAPPLAKRILPLLAAAALIAVIAAILRRRHG